MGRGGKREEEGSARQSESVRTLHVFTYKIHSAEERLKNISLCAGKDAPIRQRFLALQSWNPFR
jgi:hypothetical protein